MLYTFLAFMLIIGMAMLMNGKKLIPPLILLVLMTASLELPPMHDWTLAHKLASQIIPGIPLIIGLLFTVFAFQSFVAKDKKRGNKDALIGLWFVAISVTLYNWLYGLHL